MSVAPNELRAGTPYSPLYVVFAVDDEYVFGASVAGTSIRAGLRNGRRPIAFRAIDAGLSARGRRHLETTLGAAGDVEIVHVAGRVTLPEQVKYLTSATLGRLHLADAVPERASRAIYLDADTLVLGDLSELFQLDLGRAWIGAVVNQMSATRSVKVAKRLTFSPAGADQPGYFNDGVLVVDMEAWRANDITERAKRLYLRYQSEWGSWLDQDILNILFRGRWTRMPDLWNKLIDHSEYGPCGAGRFDFLTRPEGIVHYIGRVKPWHRQFPDNPLRRLYRDFCAAHLFAYDDRIRGRL